MRGNFYYLRLGIRISELRKKKMLSQEQLALLANIDRSYLNELEAGKANPSIKYLRKILKVLKVKMSDVVKDV